MKFHDVVFVFGATLAAIGASGAVDDPDQQSFEPIDPELDPEDLVAIREESFVDTESALKYLQELETTSSTEPNITLRTASGLFYDIKSSMKLGDEPYLSGLNSKMERAEKERLVRKKLGVSSDTPVVFIDTGK